MFMGQASNIVLAGARGRGLLLIAHSTSKSMPWKPARLAAIGAPHQTFRIETRRIFAETFGKGRTNK
jgi:hypothetical protein